MSDLPPPPPNVPPPGQEPGPGPYGAGPEPAGAGIRFGARFIDFLVLLVPNLIIGAIFGGLSAFGGDVSVGLIIGSIISTLVTFGYYAYLESSRGQTIGKQILNLRVVGPDGNHPSQDQAMRRNAWLLIGLVTWIPFLGFLLSLVQLGIVIAIAVTISNDSFKRGLHDNFAGGTAVVRSS